MTQLYIVVVKLKGIKDQYVRVDSQLGYIEPVLRLESATLLSESGINNLIYTLVNGPMSFP